MAGNDFNGDHLSDILWLEGEDIAVTNWLASPSGGFASNDANAFNQLNAFHTFNFVTAGDFDGDGRTDAIWLVDSEWYFPVLTGPAGEFPLFGPSETSFRNDAPSWFLAGSADFNGDGLSDLLWRNPNGGLNSWLATANGKFTENTANGLTSIGADWRLVGFGDFNGDGRDDILWLHDTGLMKNWLATEDGGFANSDANSLFDFTEWIFGEQIAIADFDGDGLDDLVVSDTMGEVYLFATPQDGAFHPGAWNIGYVGNAPANSRLAGSGDYNGDGIGDILWRATNGEILQWLGTGGSQAHVFTEIKGIAGLPSDWEIVANGVFDVPAFDSGASPGQLYIIPGSQTYGPVPGGDLTQINGSNLSEKVTLAADANVTFDPSFVRGNDTIVILGSAETYTIASSIAGITIRSANGAQIPIPAFGTTGGLQIRFDDGEGHLATDDGGNTFHLSGNAGVQDIGSVAVSINSAIMTFA